MYRSGTISALLLVMTPALAGCAADAGDVDEDIVHLTAQDVGTDYDKNFWGDRFIYARDEPRGTYVAQLTWKESEACKQTQHVMAQLPASETTTTICAHLRLAHRAASGGGVICIEERTGRSMPVYVLKWTNRSARELNYRVVDRGASGDHDSSGWLPDTPGNGCPRP
jgi:hypothetical protein